MAKLRARILITGRVQGVLYRASLREEAARLGVAGWARNLRDGRVESLFEGDREAVEALIAWCRRGPPLARVERVDIEWGEYTGEFSGSFGVR